MSKLIGGIQSGIDSSGTLDNFDIAQVDWSAAIEQLCLDNGFREVSGTVIVLAVCGAVVISIVSMAIGIMLGKKSAK